MARYQVFISSTFDDLKDERQCLWQRLTDHNYIVAGMENFPATSDEPFDYIKPLIDESDYFLLIIGDRYGTDFSGTGKSYTETEFDYAIAAGIPVLSFPIDTETATSRRKVDRDASRAERLDRFRARATSGRMVRTWKNAEDLASVVVQALSFEGQRKPRPGWIRRTEASELKLAEEVIRLTAENEKLLDRINRFATLTEVEMLSAINRRIDMNVRHTPDGVEGHVTYSLRRILALEPLFSEVSIDSLTYSLKIVASTTYNNGQYVEGHNDECIGYFELNNIDIDTLLLMMKQYDIIEFEHGDDVSEIRRGKNWILAQQLSKIETYVT
jgi:hypothetical protein